MASPEREFPLWHLLPNAVTLAAICAGMTAIRFAFQGNFELAAQLIILATILDGIDGRLARKFDVASELGAELDSLADFLNFGVAPAMVLYAWALQDYKTSGWIAVLFFAVCCVLRLARFNVQHREALDEEKEEAPSDFFMGVPAPAGALLVLLPLFLSFLNIDFLKSYPFIIALYMAAIGLLMISKLPTYSFKNQRVTRSWTRYILIGFVLIVGILLSYPWATMLIFDIGYFVLLLWSAIKFRKTGSTEG